MRFPGGSLGRHTTPISSPNWIGTLSLRSRVSRNEHATCRIELGELNDNESCLGAWITKIRYVGGVVIVKSCFRPSVVVVRPKIRFVGGVVIVKSCFRPSGVVVRPNNSEGAWMLDDQVHLLPNHHTLPSETRATWRSPAIPLPTPRVRSRTWRRTRHGMSS